MSDESSIKDINKENSIPEKNISIGPKKVDVNLQMGSDIDTNLIYIEADESYWH